MARKAKYGKCTDCGTPVNRGSQQLCRGCFFKNHAGKHLIGATPWNKGVILGRFPKQSSRMKEIWAKAKAEGKSFPSNTGTHPLLGKPSKQIGRTRTLEARLKMSEARKRFLQTETGKMVHAANTQKAIQANMGAIFSPERCEKIRQSKVGKRRPDIAGEKNWNWREDRNAVLEKHRVRGSLEWKQWRAAVFARDDFTCKECGVRGVYIEPHHIIPVRSDWNKLFELNNGITLCRPCHKRTMWKEDEFAGKYTALLTTA